MNSADFPYQNHRCPVVNSTSIAGWQRLKCELWRDTIALGLCLGSLWLLAPRHSISASKAKSLVAAHHSPSIHTPSPLSTH